MNIARPLNFNERITQLCIFPLLCCFSLIPAVCLAEIQFEEVAAVSGIDYRGRSWGASWGDLNGDGWPDLWVSNHQSRAVVYLNQANGTFGKLTIAEDRGDTHGAAWADFDNDGDQDLIQLSGAFARLDPTPNLLFVNEGGILKERGADFGITLTQGQGRTPLWWDWNRDGLLDLVASNSTSGVPSVLFEQSESDFHPVTILAAQNFVQPGDHTGDGLMEMTLALVTGESRVLDVGELPFTSVTGSLGLPLNLKKVRDLVTGDFNGDLLQDIFMARANWPGGSDIATIPPATLLLRLLPGIGGEGIDFKTSGDVGFLSPGLWPPSDIYIGSEGQQPSDRFFTLSATDPATHGLMDFVLGADRGIYIGYDSENGLWQLRASALFDGSEPRMNIIVQVIITGAQPLVDISTIGFSSPASNARRDYLFTLGEDGLFHDVTEQSGLGQPTECVSVVAGDFDNDMDVDLYLVCHGPLRNSPNILFENTGQGSFTRVLGAGGAAGSNRGKGESVTTVDYDNDGFLDLFVTNGEGDTAPFVDGPYQLFRNIGNGNHWIELELEGVTSNRNGIGARIYVTSGGKTQLQEQIGGMHDRSQNHQRVHFGLGDNAAVDELLIYWPSGIVQQINEISADQILRVVEPSNAGSG